MPSMIFLTVANHIILFVLYSGNFLFYFQLSKFCLTEIDFDFHRVIIRKSTFSITYRHSRKRGGAVSPHLEEIRANLELFGQ